MPYFRYLVDHHLPRDQWQNVIPVPQDFDWHNYRSLNPDLQTEMEAMIHYIRHGHLNKTCL